MSSDLVWVEQGQNLHVIRIFRNRKAAFAANLLVVEMEYEMAVGDIRHMLWLRCGGFCELCGDRVTEKSGHMHEQKHRGKGGEISMDNSVFVCAKTHKREHRDRDTRWTKAALVLLLFLFAPVLRAQTVIPFTRDNEGLMHIDATVNGVHVDAEVDTGASIALFRDKHIKLDHYGPTRVCGVVGCTKATFGQANVCVADACVRTPVALLSGIKNDIMPLSFFSQFGTMKIDFNANTITIDGDRK